MVLSKDYLTVALFKIGGEKVVVSREQVSTCTEQLDTLKGDPFEK
jgi:hypothetical protein